MEPGCTESLVRYKRLLLALRPERTQLVGECKGLLETLKGIDPMRRRRYEELGA
jgi:transposase